MDVEAIRWATMATLAMGVLALGALLARRRAPSPSALPAAPAAKDLWGHLAELRRRVLACVVAVLGGTLLAFSLRVEERGGWWAPVVSAHDNLAAQAYRAMADHLVPPGVKLLVLRPLDGFAAEVTIALAIGLAVALPVVLLQGAAFLGPALHARERRALRNAVLPAMTLFALGAGLAYALMAPILLETLYAYPVALGAEPYLLVSELVSFTLTLVLLAGFAFLAPVVMYGLARAGLVSARGFARAWRHAVVAIVVLCALVTDGTLVTLAFVVLPMVLLYFAGVGLAVLGARRAAVAETRSLA